MQTLFEQDFLNQVALPVANHYPNCLSFAQEWIKTRIEPFTSEDLIKAYKAAGESETKESRVWGAVMQYLVRNSLISFSEWGTYEGRQGHGKPTRIWKIAAYPTTKII